MQKDWSLIGIRKKTPLVIIIFILMSCNGVQNREEPDKLLSKDKMVNIYTDMVLLDAVYRTSPIQFENFDLKPSQHIYNKYKVDSTTLAENIDYYNLDFDASTEIYDQVKENVLAKNNYIDSIVKIRDSLKKLKTEKLKENTKDSMQKIDTLLKKNRISKRIKK